MSDEYYDEDIAREDDDFDFGYQGWDENDPTRQNEDLIDGVGFADPGGRSALRAETPNNSRNLPCPNCGRENMLTPIDRARGYQCDICADQAEGVF